jgi:hypothetical protein
MANFFKSGIEFDDQVTHRALLSAKSTVNENLNGGQIQAILSGFLYRSIHPVVEYTKLFDNFVAYLLFYMIKIKKRRVTYVNKNIAIARLVLYLFTDDSTLKFRLLRLLGIERYYLYRYLTSCNLILTKMADMHIKLLAASTKATTVEADALLKDQHNYAQMAASVNIQPDMINYVMGIMRMYMDCYIQYRQQVISHYYKLCYKKARRQQREKNTPGLDLREIYQNYLIAVAKAVDKYDARRGAMTSYVNWWILNVDTCDYSKYEYGIAYHIPSAYRRDMASKVVRDQTNFSVSLETAVVTRNSDSSIQLKDTIEDEGSDHAERHETDEIMYRFRRLVKSVDPTGLARISLGVEEVFNDKELTRMRQHMEYIQNKYSSSNTQRTTQPCVLEHV